ncbi:YebG family protein [Klebsiella sp. BIGb0407]|uniref:YebG family protein n=1 Tax=Klebsiella sp. BIGb0407 TaxID=2940603 RepID=UPI002166EB6C|nr:YebG family protein [Klebsiella sp. BIGb0407]MCS3430409.1 dsDNA-binding SOS-regulon protein [Klebsiella sp. BIGb0407]
MAVEIKYIVVREGQEKMAFTSKKDADAYDKMLDLADALTDWLQTSTTVIEDEAREQLGMWMAENKDNLTTILKNGKLPQPSDSETAAVENISEHASRKKRDVA